MKESKSQLPRCGGKEVSSDFEAAFSDHVGGCVRTCVCGRTLFDNANPYDWDEGELEDLQKKHEQDPDRYVALDYAASTMNIGGREIVMGCPCNSGRYCEDFLIQHATQIAEYLNKRAAALEAQAQAMKVKEQP